MACFKCVLEYHKACDDDLLVELKNIEERLTIVKDDRVSSNGKIN